MTFPFFGPLLPEQQNINYPFYFYVFSSFSPTAIQHAAPAAVVLTGN